MKVSLFRSNILNYLILIICTIITGCGITYKVRNQFEQIEENIHTPCGNIVVELIGKGNSTFNLKQRFDMENEVRVNVDSLHISYNGLPISLNHSVSNEKSSWVIFNNKSNWEAKFKLEKGVFEGDTIIVYAEEYIDCRGDIISLDSMYYTFINNLRIKGVNDF